MNLCICVNQYNAGSNVVVSNLVGMVMTIVMFIMMLVFTLILVMMLIEVMARTKLNAVKK